MKLANHMEGNTVTTNIGQPCYKPQSLNPTEEERRTIQLLLKNLVESPEIKAMAIKEQQNTSKCVYSVPVIPHKAPTLPNMYNRSKSISDAKNAFLNATINSTASPPRARQFSKEDSTLHYAQIAVTTVSEDSRSTGGGKHLKNNSPNKIIKNDSLDVNLMKIDHQRKVSFKVKTASTHRRPPLSTKTVTVSSSKVSELTQKFNNIDRNSGRLKTSRLVKKIEEQQTQRSVSNSSTPSSTLSSSPNIKIVYKQRRGSRRRNQRERCSSADSIDTMKSISEKNRVIRSKSDGTKKPTSPKKQVKSTDSTSIKSVDSVDGLKLGRKPAENKRGVNNVVKSTIKKFECEIVAHDTLDKKKPTPETPKELMTEKPKVPEKKISLQVTKNIVIKDGVPKIKIIKSIKNEPKIAKESPVIDDLFNKKKEVFCDKSKFKTNYIHSDKLQLQVVDIIHENVDETCTIPKAKDEASVIPKSEEETSAISKPEVETSIDNKEIAEDIKTYQDINPQITPNQSFLWRRKSNTQIYSDCERSADGSYSIICDPIDSVTTGSSESRVDLEEANIKDSCEGINNHQMNENKDFETNLVEAINKFALEGFTSKPTHEEAIENDYEPLEPYQQTLNKSYEIHSLKRNCPLPEIPKNEIAKSDSTTDSKENIYQCLLEMRSHPEGDESSHHSYELCENELEERTRGDGDSDDDYEYCKNHIKPYCHTSSSGIHIAKLPLPPVKNPKNYEIAKSISGTSTVSYEKIDTERIYERIPARIDDVKDVSPASTSSRQSLGSEYTSYNDGENIYDTIKHADGVSNCYESIPNSPSMVKLRNTLSFKRQLSSAVQKRLSFDQESNVSHSTISSDVKTNSIYGQRSMISYNGQEITFPAPNSESSSSDRSDDWVDVSDEEKYNQTNTIIIVKNRGRKSPVSWSQKVRDQWNNTPKFENDNNDSSHLYESLEPQPIDEDFDSFDSDTDEEPLDKHQSPTQTEPSRLAQLPDPPAGGGSYTLTKIASVARKMRELKRNLTKRYSVAIDGKTMNKQTNGHEKTKNQIYANCEMTQAPLYTNISFPERPLKPEAPLPKIYAFKEELEKKLNNTNGEVPSEKPTTPTSEQKKDSGTLSRKTYFSFKSRFKRANSVAIDIDVPSALKITNSTFYLTDSMDGDSGFSNCSDTVNNDTTSPRNSTLRRPVWSESTPCLARPAVPPPPPPFTAKNDRIERPDNAVHEELKRLLPSLSRKEKSPRTRTSWYAECGVLDDLPTPVAVPARPSSTSWYAEAGLYQAGNISTSSGASSGSHPASPLPHSLFTHEPLYQFYNAAKVESTCRETGDSDSDAYEAQGSVSSSQSEGAPSRPSAMALIAPTRGPARTLWCEVPEVINSTVLRSLAPVQKNLQEAKFEILTSEASYLNSLHVLEAHFISHPAFRDPHLLSRSDREILFSTILPVRKCSQRLMNELERCWQENILLQGLCDIVREHAQEHFDVYIKYCENQTLMVKALQRLRENPNFSASLKKLEAHPACQGLSLHSFLMLPMQRITRLPLLMDAVLKNLNEADVEYQSCMDALATLNSIVSQCNEGARNTERVEEMLRLCRSIEFPAHMKEPPSLGPAISRRDRKPIRWLVRSGEMTQLVWKDEHKLTFGRKAHKIPLHVFLFNDLLVITKKKSEDVFIVIEYCTRSLVEVCDGDEVAGGVKFALLITLLENHSQKTVEMLMSCPSATDVSRWKEALVPADGKGGETLYGGWDCPQVAALYTYSPAQPDELPLAQGDVVNVHRKTNEGWYYGERIRDGEFGWFPGSYTVEIASPHVRARNLKQRYRLLALSGSYLGQKKKPS